MSRRKQACPIRSIKAVDEPPTVVEADNDDKDPELLAGTDREENCDNASDAATPEKNADIPQFAPLVINTDNPSPPPAELSTLDDTPPLTNSTSKAPSSSPEDHTTQPFPSTSPGLDIPPLTASVARDVVPLSLTLPSSPNSPDHPSTPSSLNSGCSLLESSANKQRRGKKIMPVAGNDGKSRWQCPICSEQLGSDHDFTAHIRSHNTTQAKQPNTCTICGKVLSSQSSLDRHMLVHSGERPFRCKVCKMSFTTNGNMHRHSRIHNKEELKAATAAANLESGKRPSKSRSSSSKASSMSAAAAKSPSSAIGSFSGVSANHWHRPGVFGSERPGEPAPVSGVDLQKFISAKSLQRPSHLPYPSMVPNQFMSPIHVLSRFMEMENRKRFMPSYLTEDMSSPPKQPKLESEEPKDMVRRLSHRGSSGGGDTEDGNPSAASTKEEAGSVSQSRRKSLRRSHQSSSSNPDKQSDDSHHQPAHDECKHCHKTFLSDYGLEYHLSQHHKNAINATSASLINGDADESRNSNADEHPASTSGAFKCSKCEESFSSQPLLVVHNLMVHLTNQQVEEAVAEALEGGKNGLSKVVIEAAMPGFSDLDFMDFTTDKFSLAAKAWCEQMPRRSMSKYHDFTCEECSCSFPSRSSLVLHRASHQPQNWTKCQRCECYFVSKDLLLVHMYKHAADQSFADSLKQDKSENAGMPESMAKNDFLAMFEVVAKEELCSSTANEDVIQSINKEQNDKYYAKLNKVFAQKKSDADANDAKSSSSNDDSGNGSSSTGSGIPTTPTHDSKALTPSKNIPVIPSMSTPPGVLSLAAQGGLSSSTSIFPPYLAAKAGMFGQGEFSPTRFGSPSVLGMDMDANQDQKKGVYNCQFCGETFLNSRALKGHTRIHLGLSPYKCQFCSYSSADKSTLIRHMRTHNGQRPFMCTTCKYAFTTKANCERHIRKKHGVNDKEEIERSVTFKSCPADPTEGIECFQSPDTVCQYCGEDFKFFRSLKNHLKTHSSCRQKPFTCTKCLVGFSMKANVIRHIQKQHLEVPHKDIENYILVNEPSVTLDGDGDSDNLGADYETGSPSPSSTPGASGQDSTPPLAHSTPVYATTAKNAIAQPDAPLDFSLKNSDLAARLTGMMNAMMPQSAGSNAGSAGASSAEQPIDLTVKRRPLSSTTPSSVASLSPKPATPSTPGQAPSPAKPQPSSTTEIPCNLCNKILANKEAAQQHLIEVHQIPPSVFTTLGLPGSDNNNNTSGAGGQLASILPLPTMLNSLHFNSQLSTLLQARVALARATGGGGVPVFPTHPAFPHVQAYLQSTNAAPSAAASSASKPAIRPSLLASAGAAGTAVKKEPGTTSSTMSTGSESSCDLASVNKIIESTTTQNIEIFLKPQVINSGSDDSEPHTTTWESADEDSDQSLEQLYKQSLNGKISVKSEPLATEEVTSEDKEDENEDFDGEQSDEEDRDSDAEMDKSENKFGMEDSMETNSTKSSSSKAGTEPKSDAGAAPVKKKRNSYADSPHKLNCPHCPRSFPWVSSLNRHMLTHTGQKPFKCPRCPVTFSTKSNRERHLIRKHGVNMLDPASRQTMDRPYKCHLCVFSSFSTESNLLKHYKERHPGCTPPERYLMKMEGEMEALELGQQMDKMDELAMAGLDSNSNMDDWSESASLDAEDEEGLAPTTKTPVSTMVENVVVTALLKKEAKTSPVSTTIKGAENGPSTRNGISSSTAATNNNNGYDENDNEDDSSDIPMSAASFSGSAERHINPERDNYNVDKITFCWKCGEQFTSRKVLVRHLKEHNIDLPFKCYLCDASYESRHECLLHQEKSHASDWAILQEKNGVDNLDEYAEKLDRIVERNCRTGQFGDDAEEGDSVAVPADGEDGQTEMVASDYLQRKVYCSLCSKRFWSLQDLRRHMRSHTGERPFECDKCQKRFTLKHSMMRHRRKHTTTGNTDSPAAFSDDEDDIQALDTSSSGKAPAVNMGTGHKALRQHLAAAVMRAANIPTTVSESRRNNLMTLRSNKNEEQDDDEDEDQDDMLHNLLGVESSTIDQMIEAKASAASLLGV